MNVREMINTHPDVQGSTADKLLRCIEDCYSCAQTCIEPECGSPPLEPGDGAADRRRPLFRAQPTLMFNGYEEKVAHLYNGMDLTENF